MNQPNPQLSREELALAYLEQLPFVPYPVQERALLAWFETSEGILVSAPTGTGKTLIAEAAVYVPSLTRRVAGHGTTGTDQAGLGSAPPGAAPSSGVPAGRAARGFAASAPSRSATVGLAIDSPRIRR
ncbi:MAG: hypothetical protein ACKOGA_06455, partial [Planctomycetaceae bacterium]